MEVNMSSEMLNGIYLQKYTQISHFYSFIVLFFSEEI